MRGADTITVALTHNCEDIRNKDNQAWNLGKILHILGTSPICPKRSVSPQETAGSRSWMEVDFTAKQLSIYE
jgi:hypothetical protein